jgi:cyclophilin family peptidyl-prolyl cis-trans isomerase
MKYLSILIIILSIFACSAPKAIFFIDKNESTAPVTVSFKNQSLKAINYVWDFGDGKTSEEQNPTHKYILSGKYNVTLKAINKKKVNSLSQTIIIDPPHHCLVEIHTSMGNMTIQLYDETPLHRDNFIKLAEEGFYEDLLFHRVIKGFMVQAGDPNSKNAAEGKKLGSGGPNYKIPAEINEKNVHVKGAIAAARQGDAVNPKKESSGSQFYIVHGKPLNSSQIESFEFQKGIKYSDEDKQILLTEGGTPTLDQEYTVFGRVIKGLDIIDKIAESKTDSSDRPINDVKIISIKIIK